MARRIAVVLGLVAILLLTGCDESPSVPECCGAYGVVSGRVVDEAARGLYPVRVRAQNFRQADCVEYHILHDPDPRGQWTNGHGDFTMSVSLLAADPEVQCFDLSVEQEAQADTLRDLRVQMYRGTPVTDTTRIVVSTDW